MSKSIYVLSRDLSLFNLPGLRKLRNRAYSNHLNARYLNVDRNVRIQALHSNDSVEVKIGEHFHVGADCLVDLSGGLVVGDRVTISEGAKLYTHTHPIDGGSQDWSLNPIKFSKLVIEDDVWIGAGAIILSTVNVIGAGAVIAAGSIVRKDVTSLSVVAGVPAKEIRTRDLKT